MEVVANGCVENSDTKDSDIEEPKIALSSPESLAVQPSKTQIAATPRRRKELTLEEKIQVIEESCEKGNSQRILAKKYEVSKTQIHRILTHKQDLLRLYNDCKNGGLTVYNPHGIYLSPVSKRLSGYNSEFDDINAETWEWYRDMKDQKMEITGPMIKRKAREIAQRLGKDEKFKGSNGWLEKIKKRFETHYSHWEQVKRQQEEYKVEPMVSLEEETASDLALVPVVTQLETENDSGENNDDIINIDTAIYYTRKLRQFAEANNYHVLLSVFTFAEQSLEKGGHSGVDQYQVDYTNEAKNH